MSAFTSAVDFLPRDGDADLGRCLPQKPMLTAAPPAVRPANDFPPSIRPALRRCCDCIHGSPALAGSAVSWHSCAVPKESRWHGQWGLSEHYCGSWELHSDRRHPTDTGGSDRGRPNSRVTSRHFDYGKSRRVFMSRSNRPTG